jgi:hypothetical protein
VLSLTLRVGLIVWGVLLVALIIPQIVDLSHGDVKRGEALYKGIGQPPLPCTVCHFNRAVAPPLHAIAQRVAEQRLPAMAGETETVMVYLAESILDPSRYLTPSYPDAMPRGFGHMLSLQDTQDLVAYLMTL